MKLLKTALIALSTLALNAYADLGDTLTSSEAKYGEATQRIYRHIVEYNVSDQWRITATFNDSGICVGIEFIKLKGGPITENERISMNVNNLPEYTRSVNDNGWVKTKLKNQPCFKNAFSYVWTNNVVQFEVIDSFVRYSQSSNDWYEQRQYFTPESHAITNRDLVEAMKFYDDKAKKDKAVERQKTTTTDAEVRL